MSEGSDEMQLDERADAGAVDDDMKALLDSVLHQLLPAAIERMLPAGSAGLQLSADACQASKVVPAMLVLLDGPNNETPYDGCLFNRCKSSRVACRPTCDR